MNLKQFNRYNICIIRYFYPFKMVYFKFNLLIIDMNTSFNFTYVIILLYFY